MTDVTQTGHEGKSDAIATSCVVAAVLGRFDKMTIPTVATKNTPLSYQVPTGLHRSLQLLPVFATATNARNGSTTPQRIIASIAAGH